ncbi:PPE domain-containing protein [Nocardia sp. NPDC049149]|uniref:PPE domain-containing protein n=1 Tax=Nocardia sp. NPDC049149 TaxID=3364315 RepID=UPI00371B841A
MIEPPQPGFTGVVWEAREPDRLTRELSTGPGAIPMAEAGATWAKLAAGFGSAVVEYDLIIASLHGAWESSTSSAVLDRISKLRDWLTDSARAAGENAAHAEKQAAAFQLAQLTMPNALDIAAIKQAQHALEAVSGALGAPIKAVAAQTDAEADLAKAAASRVMRTYEAATEPLAAPWQHEQPPVIASPAALEAEQPGTAQAANSATMPASASGMGLSGFGLPGPIGPISVPRPLTTYQAPMAAQTAQVAETVAPQPIPTTTPVSSSMLPPGAIGPSAMGAQDEEYESARAGVAPTAEFDPDLGIVSAPSVLGAPEPQASTGRAATGGGA